MAVSFEDVASGTAFEAYARRYFSDLWGIELRERSVRVGGAVPKKFDLVSEDRRFVGEAKWYTNIRLYPGYGSTIAEYVWLLQKVEAARVFIVFGQEAEVPRRFLERYRALVSPVEFYFLDDSGHCIL